MRVTVLALLCGCGTLAFSPHLGDNDPSQLAAALRRMDVREGAPRLPAGPTNAGKRPLVLAAAHGKGGGRIVAYDLGAGRVLWSQPADVRSRIVMGATSVYYREGKDALVARSLDGGGVLWRAALSGGGRFLGLAVGTRQVVYVTEAEGARVEGRDVASITALDADSGAVRWHFGAAGSLGAPVAAGTLVLVPFSHQYLSLLDAATGTEVARLRNREEEIEFVVPTPEGVFFGSRGLFRLDGRVAHGVAAESTYLRAALPEEFLRAAYAGDGYNPAQAQYTAYDRNRLLWRAASDGRGFRDGRVFLHNYRFVFAMDAVKGGVLWAYAFPGQDLVASADLGATLALVSAAGDIVVLDAATGVPLVQGALGAAVAGATIDADGFSVPDRRPAPTDTLETLTEIIWDPDRRFDQVKLYCVAELARSRDPRVVDTLIRIVTHENVERRVYERAADMLVERADAASAPRLLAALSLRTDYLASTRARGVEALARAAAKVGARELVPPLLAHLRDAETPAAALEAIVGALVALADPSVVEPLAQFLLDYRADEALEAHPEALRRTVDGLLRLGGPANRQLLGFVQGDPATRPFLRAYVGTALGAGPPPVDRAATR
jgi:outer membrane protein assembly factor BamB